MINLGDIVENVKSGKIGLVVRINKNGSILVLENVAPFVWCTHDNERTLKIVEKRTVNFKDERFE